MVNVKEKNRARIHRHRRVRKKVFGTPGRPRLVVFRSGKHIYAQIINDMSGQTLAGASSLEKEYKKSNGRGCTKESASIVGSIIAKRALEKNLKQVVFDRNGYLYHGRVKALADAARQEGLIF